MNPGSDTKRNFSMNPRPSLQNSFYFKIFIMKKIFCYSCLALAFSYTVSAQNVGINNPNPGEKLDVNGNINVTGTIKANGVDGAPNQVLMKNSSGNFSWGDISSFQNFVTFAAPGSSNWTVPAGVTKVWAELWGGGGGSSPYGGGGGGGYLTGVLSVTPGSSVGYTVAAGGTATGTTGNNGGSSNITYGSTLLSAFGGYGAISSGTMYVANGGTYFVLNATSYYFEPGESGGTNTFQSMVYNGTTYREAESGGKGGDAGHTIHTGGGGAYQLRNVGSTAVYTLYPNAGSIPGGGGGGTYIGNGQLSPGGSGMVIIHY